MLNKISYIIFLVLLMQILSGCIDPYETKAKQGEKRLVVEGHITSSEGPYFVTLSYSGNYSQTLDGVAEFISKAYVCIHDNEGNCAELHEIGSGRYSTGQSSFRGKIGHSYHLEIILPNGKRYLSQSEKMLKPPEIKQIYDEYYPGSDLKEEGFYVYIDVKDPEDEVNFYKWETISWYLYSVDPCWKRIPEFDPFNIESDKNINGNLIEHKLLKIVPYNSKLPYVVSVNQEALTENAYNFLKSLNDQLQLSGSVFDPPPTFIWGNIENSEDPDELVLGYFYAAGSSDVDIAVDRSVLNQPPKKYLKLVPAPQYCGDPCEIRCVIYTGGKCGLAPCPPECNNLENVTYKPPKSWPLIVETCDE